MGYEVHITKKEFWADEDGAILKKEDWNNYVNSDPEIVQDKNNSEDDYLVKDSVSEWPIFWSPDIGEIYTKNPTDLAIEKLKVIAKKLNAKVQGDDGEYYE